MQFYTAWVIVGIIWLWLSMLVAIFYPIFDGGIQQIRDVYRGLRGGNNFTGTAPTSISPSTGSISDATRIGDIQEPKE